MFVSYFDVQSRWYIINKNVLAQLIFCIKCVINGTDTPIFTLRHLKDNVPLHLKHKTVYKWLSHEKVSVNLTLVSPADI